MLHFRDMMLKWLAMAPHRRILDKYLKLQKEPRKRKIRMHPKDQCKFCCGIQFAEVNDLRR